MNLTGRTAATRRSLKVTPALWLSGNVTRSKRVRFAVGCLVVLGGETVSGHHSVAIRGVVEEDCLHDSCLFEVGRMQAIQGVHTGVVGTGS